MSYARERKAHIDRISAAGFVAGAKVGETVSTYDEDDENHLVQRAAPPGYYLAYEAVIWRCGFRIGFLTRIVERGL